MDPDTSPSVLRALAHPLRVRLLNFLVDAPATSAQLARRTGQTRGNISYHLRFLARAGLLEEELDQGTDRERWWRAAALPELAAQDLIAGTATPRTVGRRARPGGMPAPRGPGDDIEAAADAVLGERSRRLAAFADRLRTGQVPPARAAAARVGELRLRIPADAQADLVTELDAVLSRWEATWGDEGHDGEVVEVQLAVFLATQDA